MADEEMMRPVQSGKTPEVEELNEFNFISFEQDRQVNSFVENQRKRMPKRSFAGFGLTTLSLSNDSATRLKKRNRKDDKRVVVDSIDRFTFVSAFTLNDFDEYDKNPVKRPLAPTKRKITTKNESATSNKKAKKTEHSENLEACVNVVKEGQSNLTPKKSPVVFETVSNASKKKNISPLTKSALVRLKKINVSSLNQNTNSPLNEDKQDGSKVSTQKNSSSSKAKKSINLKVPSMHINKPGKLVNSNSLPNTKKSTNSKIPHMQIDKPAFNGAGDDWFEMTSIILSDDEDNVELDVCGVDEYSSSQFILNNINNPEEKNLGAPAKPTNQKKGNLKRKPCRVCCVYPCRIVGAKRIKSPGNQFPSFDVSFTSRCQVHTPGEIAIHRPSQGKVNACIQTTSTDIRMHLDFARRFPYRTINVVSCQPSLYDEDLKLPDNLAAEPPQRCSEHHRILEQKRREELHGLYCKLADTLSISKNRASKQWILENALKEIKCLEAKDTLLTAKLNSEKSKNEKKRERWEELAGKPYVAPEESTTKVASKSKLLELYEQYRDQLKNKTTKEAEEKLKSKERERLEKDLLKNIKNSRSRNPCDHNEKQTPSNNPASTVSNRSSALAPSLNNQIVCESELVTPKTKDVVVSINPIMKSSRKEKPQNTASSMQSSLMSTTSTPVTASPVESEANHIQSISIDTLITTAKHASLGPRQIVRPFQHTPISSTSPSSPVIPRIDLTNESETSTVKSNQLETLEPKLNQSGSLTPKSNPLSELSQLLRRNPNLATTASNVTPPVATLFKRPPPTQSSTLSATPSISTSDVTDLNTLFPTPIAPKPSNSVPPEASNIEYVMVTIVVRGKKTIFRIPKTAEGLTLLSKLSSKKMLSPDSLTKIAAHFPLNQPEQLASTTASLNTATSLVTTNSLVTTSAAPTQWLAVASIPSTSVTATCQPVQQSSATATNDSSVVSTSQPVKQPTQLVKANSSFATISRPIKEPTTTVNTVSGNVGTTSQPKQPFHVKTSRLRNNSDVILSERVKQFNALRPCRSINIDQTYSNVSQQQKKLIFLDLTSKNKPEAKAFSVIPTSSSINLTLNKLGSITANKVFNKSPAPRRPQNNPPNASFTTHPVPPVRSQNSPQKASFVTNPAPSASQTNPSNASFTNGSQTTNQPKLNYEYHLQRTTPIQIIPKRVLDTNMPTSITCTSVPMPSVHISPAPPAHIPSEEPPEDLPEIPPDIPSDLTRTSLTPLETIPKISDSLLEGPCQKDTDNVNELGFCVISNVFSLTDTANDGTPNNLEKTTDASVVDAKVNTNVSDTADAPMTVSSDMQGEIVNVDLQKRCALS